MSDHSMLSPTKLSGMLPPGTYRGSRRAERWAGDVGGAAWAATAALGDREWAGTTMAKAVAAAANGRVRRAWDLCAHVLGDMSMTALRVRRSLLPQAE
jgi:hypothetical protein